MCVRLIVLGALVLLLGIAVAVCTWGSLELMSQMQVIYEGTQQPSQKQMDAADALATQAYTLQLLVTPLAVGSLLSALAVPIVLARRWQLREQRLVREADPSASSAASAV